MGCIVTESVAMLMYSSISTRTVGIAFSIKSKEFREYSGVEDKALGLLVRFGVLLLAKGDYLQPWSVERTTCGEEMNLFSKPSCLSCLGQRSFYLFMLQ